MVDVRRKGSLAWQKNSKRGIRTLIPVVKKKYNYAYFVKIGMTLEKIDGRFYPTTLLKEVPFENKSKNQYIVKFEDLKIKRSFKKNCIREQIGMPAQDISKEVLNSEYVDAIGTTKGVGFRGPVWNYNLSLGLRKAKRSNAARSPGSRGCRGEAKVAPTRPNARNFSHNRRTILNLKVLGSEFVNNATYYRCHVKEGLILKIKGSLPGKLGTVILLRKAIRK